MENDQGHLLETLQLNQMYEQTQKQLQAEKIEQILRELRIVATDPRVNKVMFLPPEIQNAIANSYIALRFQNIGIDQAFLAAIAPYTESIIKLNQYESILPELNMVITSYYLNTLIYSLPEDVKKYIIEQYIVQRNTGKSEIDSLYTTLFNLSQVIGSKPEYTQISLTINQMLNQIRALPTSGGGGARTGTRRKTHRRLRITSDNLETKIKDVLAKARRRHRAKTAHRAKN